jgi:hypothetical protein
MRLLRKGTLAMTKPRVRDASENPFVRYEQKIEATARPFRGTPLL